MTCKNVLAKLFYIFAPDENLGFAPRDGLGRRALSLFYPAPGHASPPSSLPHKFTGQGMAFSRVIS